MIKKVKTVVNVFKTFGLAHTFSLAFKKAKISRRPKPANNSGIVQIDINDRAELLKFLRRRFGIEDKLIEETTVLITDLYNHRSYSKTYQRTQFFDKNYDLGENTGFLVTSLVIKLKPRLVLETGVAAGLSSSHILKALNFLSERGKLVSIDITEKCGELIPMELKSLWDLRVLKGKKEVAFESIIENLEHCDIFVHDSDHSSHWQQFEISTVLKKFPQIKVIIVDDPATELLHRKIEGFERFLIGETNKIAAVFVRN